MGCRQSKSASNVLNDTKLKKDPQNGKEATTTSPNGSMKQTASSPSTNTNPPRARSSDRVYKLLLKTPNGVDDNKAVLQAVTPSAAAYRNPVTAASPLHLAVQLLDSHLATMTNATKESSLVQVISELIRAYPEAVYSPDAAGYIPLHYAIAPCSGATVPPPSKGKQSRAPNAIIPSLPPTTWRWRAGVVRLLLAADTTSASYDYLARNDVSFHDAEMVGGCSPLYRIVQSIPDDDTPQQAPTLEYLHVVLKYMVQQAALAKEPKEEKEPMVGTPFVGMGNHSDGDKPLALLYRRFTRQFDLAEKFFDGDNSRTEVVEHRRKYKTSAGNTWKMMELLLKQQEQLSIPVLTSTPVKTTHRTVHRAVQGETPPDLLRYIVETNADDLTIPDDAGNLPLHYAARYRPKDLLSLSSKGGGRGLTKAVFPAFYSKYVIDELLYKYPEAAMRKDVTGNYPLLLAVQSGKQWIGGGTKSLYDAYPEALQQIQLGEYPSLQRALMALDDVDETKEEKVPQRDIIRDEQYDAIMLVQGDNVDISEVVTSMWAHEEDPGVQMLGCVAIRRLLRSPNGVDGNAEHCLRIALSAVPAVVNAMKAHPNEVIVQEKACHTLRAMATADGKREVSFVASGAVAAIVGAMQAHVSDAGVQEEALGALGQILQFGGADRATVIASVSGLTAMLNAIAAHPMVRGVQREGCGALRELTNYAATANLPELPQSQTEALLDHAKTIFPEDCKEDVDVLLTRLS
jgi:hypothetical protein